MFRSGTINSVAASYRIQCDITGFNGEGAPFGHCITCVHHQIYDYLNKLRWINPDSPEMFTRAKPDSNIFADKMVKGPLAICYCMIQINGLGGYCLLP